MRRASVVLGIVVAAAVPVAGWTDVSSLVGVEQGAVALAVVVLGALGLRRPGRGRHRIDGQPYEAGRRQWSTLYQLESTVMIGTQSRHHYDQGLRPRLQRVLTAVAASRCGLDLTARPGDGRDLVGEALWPLVDPARPPSRDSRAGGVDLAALERLLDRIERLPS